MIQDRAAPRHWNARKLWVWLHRWVSLVTGLLLVLLGLSGSALVWRAELDAALNPAWLQARPACQAAVAESGQHAPVRRVLQVFEEAAPGRTPALIMAPLQPGAAYQVWERRDPQTGWRREHFIDARCGLYLGHRERGAVRWDAAHLMPTLFELHRYLLSGETGETVAGIGGLVLLGLGLSGLWLSWPRPSWRSWRQALSVKTGTSAARTWFDVHRAVGLWMAPVLIVLSLTGAALALGESTRALVGALLPVQALPKLKQPSHAAGLSSDWDYDALTRRAEAQFPPGQARWTRISLGQGDGGQAELRLLQHGEWRKDTGSTRLRLNREGRPLALHDPLNTAAGNQLLDLIYPLHKGDALGLGARLLWTAFGVVPAVLLGSGVYLWLRRRAARA